MPSRPGHGARLAPLPFLLHALFFIAAATQSAVVPLLPRLSAADGVSPAASAVLLAAPGLATLVISLPAGVFADRLGARRMTVAATALMCAAALAQATPTYPVLLVGRLAFGLAFGTVWTTGVAWMAGDAAGSPHLGAVATSAAVGMVAGPAIGGVIADALGLSAPFLLLGLLTAALSILLWCQPPAAPTRAARVSLLALVRLVPDRPGIVGGAVVLAIAGAVGGVTQLIVPLQLQAAGISAAGTGIVFSGAAGLYIIISAFVVRLGGRATTLRAIALAGLALAFSLLPATLDTTTSVVVGVLILSTAPRAVASTVAYPLATQPAERTATGSVAGQQVGDGAVIGLLNATWALGLVVAPLLAAALDQAAGPRIAYLSAVVPGAIAALWLLRRRTRWTRRAELTLAAASG